MRLDCALIALRSRSDRALIALGCQLEFADLLLLNKTDLVTPAQRGVVESYLRKINPTAEIVCTERSVLEPATLLSKGRFSMERAEQHRRRPMRCHRR